MNLVSIIIPTYNRKLFLFQAVESCLKQTYPNIEIIIVDDGSSDGTKEALEKALDAQWKDKCIRYVEQKNSGASAARNKGLQLAKGEYIQFLDSDDLLFPGKIEIQLKKMTSNRANGCSCYGIMGENIKENGIKLGETFVSVLDLMHKMCSGKVHVMSTPAPLWQKSVIDKTAGWNTQVSFGDDTEFHIRALSKVKKMVFVPEKLFFVREHHQERLSKIDSNLKQLESAIKTQRLITYSLKINNLWDIEFQKGILKRSKTTYINFLKTAANSEITEFENWILNTALKPKFKPFYFILIYVRRVFGNKIILRLYNIYYLAIH